MKTTNPTEITIPLQLLLEARGYLAITRIARSEISPDLEFDALIHELDEILGIYDAEDLVF